jgi:hypothetical protein
METPEKIWLYRIIHIDNLDYILKNGIYTSESPNFDPDFKSIGDPSLINYRKNISACDPPGGYLSEYIPFYFGPRSPMLFQIAKGYEDIPKHPQEDIIYLITSFNQVKLHQLEYFFTDGNARSETANKYNNEHNFQSLDWTTIYGTYWKSDETDLLRKQKKQSEFLVKNYVPITCIEYIGVYNDVAKQNILHLLINSNLNIPVKVSPAKLYYDNL